MRDTMASSLDSTKQTVFKGWQKDNWRQFWRFWLIGGAVSKLQYGVDPTQLLPAQWMIIIPFTRRSIQSASLPATMTSLISANQTKPIWLNTWQICQQKWVASLPPGAMPRTESLEDLVLVFWKFSKNYQWLKSRYSAIITSVLLG